MLDPTFIKNDLDVGSVWMLVVLIGLTRELHWNDQHWCNCTKGQVWCISVRVSLQHKLGNFHQTLCGRGWYSCQANHITGKCLSQHGEQNLLFCAKHCPFLLFWSCTYCFTLVTSITPLDCTLEMKKTWIDLFLCSNWTQFLTHNA